MKALYGAPAFCSAYGDTPPPIWVAAIGKLSDDECRDGLTRLAHEAREFPANLTQFIGACRPPTGSPRFLGVPVTPESIAKSLPAPSRMASPEKIDGWIAKMRAKVGRYAPPPARDTSMDGACTCRGEGECAVCKRLMGAA